MKKILALVLALCMVFALCACGSKPAAPAASAAPEAPAADEAEAKTIKFGLITLHDENSTYDANFIKATEDAKAILAAEGIDVEFVVKTGYPEDQTCYEVACDLADDGCDIVMGDSFGHEPYIIQAAKEYPEVQFLHATGYQASIEQLSNFHDAFAAIYEGRYLAGVAAGLKLQEMIDADVLTADNYDADGNIKLGYIGAFTYAEVVSGYTSWFLGVRSVVENVVMQVTFTGSWYDETAEKEAANTLISNGCALISQHADSMGAPTACETAGVPDVTYNVSTEAACPNTYICYSRINWAPFYVFAVESVVNGEAMPADWTGSIATDSVQFGLYGAAAAEGTEAAVEAVKAQIVSGDLHVFDVSTFTVVEADAEAFAADAMNNGEYYAESSVVSAPSFQYTIEGITLLDTAF